MTSGLTPQQTFDALASVRRRLRAADDHVLATQVAIAEIPSPTGSEDRRAAFVADRLQAAAHVSRDQAGNVLAWLPGTIDDAPVVVCAHLDTVFPATTPVVVRRDGAQFRGPGISDNARGLAALIALGDARVQSSIRTRRPVLLAATTGEEGDGDLRGARHLFDTAASGAWAAIAIDGAGDDRIVSHALGCVRLRFTVGGAGGHSWAAFGTPNAIHAIGNLVARLSRIAIPDTPRATLSVCRMAGGSAINAIPSHAWIDVDIRSTSPQVLRRLADESERHARDAVAHENGDRRSSADALHLSVARIGERPAGQIDHTAPLLDAACQVTRAIGRQPQMAIASTDANIPTSLGIPAIAIGAGGSAGRTHTVDEWFDPTDAHLGIARALAIVASAAELA